MGSTPIGVNAEGVVVHSDSHIKDKIPLESSIVDYKECPVFTCRGRIGAHKFAMPSQGRNGETLEFRRQTLMKNLNTISRGNDGHLTEPVLKLPDTLRRRNPLPKP
eukprot:813878_1